MVKRKSPSSSPDDCRHTKKTDALIRLAKGPKTRKDEFQLQQLVSEHANKKERNDIADRLKSSLDGLVREATAMSVLNLLSAVDMTVVENANSGSALLPSKEEDCIIVSPPVKQESIEVVDLTATDSSEEHKAMKEISIVTAATASSSTSNFPHLFETQMDEIRRQLQDLDQQMLKCLTLRMQLLHKQTLLESERRLFDTAKSVSSVDQFHRPVCSGQQLVTAVATKSAMASSGSLVKSRDQPPSKKPRNRSDQVAIKTEPNSTPDDVALSPAATGRRPDGEVPKQNKIMREIEVTKKPPQFKEVTPKQKIELRGHTSIVKAVQVWNSAEMFSLSRDGSIKCFTVLGQRWKSVVCPNKSFAQVPINTCCMQLWHHQDDSYVLAATASGLLFKFYASNLKLCKYVETGLQVTTMVAKTNSIFLGTLQGQICRYNPHKLDFLTALQASQMPVTCLRSTTIGDLQVLCIATADGIVSVRDENTGHTVQWFELEGRRRPQEMHVLDSNIYIRVSGSSWDEILVYCLTDCRLLHRVNCKRYIINIVITNTGNIVIMTKDGEMFLYCNARKWLYALKSRPEQGVPSVMVLHRNNLIIGYAHGHMDYWSYNNENMFS